MTASVQDVRHSLAQIFELIPEDRVGQAVACTAEAIAETQTALAAAQHTTEGASDDEAEAIAATLRALLAALHNAHGCLVGGMHSAQQSKDHVTSYSGRL
jgi:hypothetical protein